MLMLAIDRPATLTVAQFLEVLHKPVYWPDEKIPEKIAFILQKRGLGVIDQESIKLKPNPRTELQQPTSYLMIEVTELPLGHTDLEKILNNAFPEAEKNVLLMKMSQRTLTISRNE